jgi:DNA repair ATPase RecN
MDTTMNYDEALKELETMKSEIAEIEDFLSGDSKDEKVNQQKIARLKELNEKYSKLTDNVYSENAPLTQEMSDEAESNKTEDKVSNVVPDTSNANSNMGNNIGTSAPTDSETAEPITTCKL